MPSPPIIAFENSAVPAGLDLLPPKPGVETPGYCRSPLRGSRHNVGRGDGGAKRASRRIADFFNAVNTAIRTWRNFAVAVELDVRRQVVGIVDGFTIGLAFLQSELLGRAVNLTKIVDTGISTTRASRTHEIGDGNDYQNPHAKNGQGNQHPCLPRYR